MSQEVQLDQLAEAMGDYDYAYLLTLPESGAPHAVAVVPTIDDTTLTVAGLGRRTAANAAARPTVSLVWPPRQPGDYSLIVDGTAAVETGGPIVITPTRAVRHRPAPGMSTEPNACVSDCIEIPITS